MTEQPPPPHHEEPSPGQDAEDPSTSTGFEPEGSALELTNTGAALEGVHYSPQAAEPTTAFQAEETHSRMEDVGYIQFQGSEQSEGVLVAEGSLPDPMATEFEPPLFQSYLWPKYIFPARIPHLGHLGLLAAMALFGLLGASLLTRSALYFHLFGVSTVKQAVEDFRYTLGSQTAFYLLTFLACLVFFPLVWGKSFFAGVQWNASSAGTQRWRLIGAAVTCFVLAMIDGMLLPGPNDTPIDKVLRSPDAAWLLFAFGVTLAPFFEEIAFRGFLLPTLCTAYDWFSEQTTGQPAPLLGPKGHPQWSIPAMVVASILTSIPFALMHAEQTGYSIGPFLLLLCVSLVLCWARLSTRSLAASVLVHACYNFMLFAFMLLGTGGFQHLDKM
jgi:membrane protease YdiL (CAAX protease family)